MSRPLQIDLTCMPYRVRCLSCDWLLVIVSLTAPVGVNRMTVLNTVVIYEDDQMERDP